MAYKHEMALPSISLPADVFRYILSTEPKESRFMNLILSSRNKSKIVQIKAALDGLPLTVLSLEDAGILGDVAEDGTTLHENAYKKAMFAHKQTKGWVIAEDTGFFIDALDGRPGIHAARWAGDGLSTEDIMHYTLRQLQGVPEDKRTATFTTVAVLISPEGTVSIFTGSVKGRLLTSPRTTCQPNMPYSALFMPNGTNKVWAEMDTDEENKVSHRGKAFRQVRDFLSELLA